MSLLNLSWIVVALATPLDVSAGETERTLGVDRSGAVPVVKVLVKAAAMAFPAISFTPAIITV